MLSVVAFCQDISPSVSVVADRRSTERPDSMTGLHDRSGAQSNDI